MVMFALTESFIKGNRCSAFKNRERKFVDFDTGHTALCEWVSDRGIEAAVGDQELERERERGRPWWLHRMKA